LFPNEFFEVQKAAKSTYSGRGFPLPHSPDHTGGAYKLQLFQDPLASGEESYWVSRPSPQEANPWSLV